ncbi:nitrite reductase large subunit NirB [Halobacillus karajensis]|uniref:Nitrite reductase [NAD(P)H] n=1 Tax=Halobacillus karajensis TaxID=195088 RepID=A0A024P4I9_9BACI|nr:nitrite reductase large subunit NirB [Halobacillus karajensis]CDQ20740.1 Nitrite reductase [NAD(P)H] [Halobacillus karajensis]CDQ23790.1 Nitrite reductase [NAD(P)H] [Halobacillus karajensis]CDQ27268.1 Nitrite reductase [NAD(P)H] [Halobacillus karajensis]
MEKQKLILIGNGMAGIRTLEEVLKLEPDTFDITVFGKEPYPNYNRIELSKVLQGDTSVSDITLNEWHWYEDNNIRLYPGETVTRIDKEQKIVYTDKDREESYDQLIIATGSDPVILPLPGIDKEGVTAFRDIKDCEKMVDYSKKYKKAAVIGGGLLGLEAARGLLNLGMEVDVIHLCDSLMERQLDKEAGTLLKEELEEQGMHFLLEKQTSEILGNDHVSGLRFNDGEEIEADLIVMAVGIKPNVALAKESGIEVNRGIVVNDYLETNDPNIFSVGECAEHREMVYGLVAPLYQQAQVLAKRICGMGGDGYKGSVLSTQLKVSGVDVFSTGQIMENEHTKAIKVFDDWRGVYKKIVVEQGKITGAVLFGDTGDGNRLLNLIKKGADVEEYTDTDQNQEAGAGLVADMPDDELICGCNGVTKGTIIEAIETQGLNSVEQVKGCTNASRSCGTCKSLVSDLLEYTLGEEYDENQKETVCGCTTLSKDEVIAEIKEKGMTNTREVMNVLGWKNEEGCAKCKPALNYYLGMLYPTEYEDERESRFVNERLHANIQKDGTFGVIPRMYGGVTNAQDLRKIADVAEKYDVGMIKLTGGQRINLLGVNKQDLPNIWEELDMPSGHAYAKGLRTVKTCVGSEFCRFGTQDSTGLGIRLEKKFEGLSGPHKLKMGVSACPRNCAEGGVKDVGVVGLEGVWEIYVGGNGGTDLRQADLLCKVETGDEVLEWVGAFLQYYRETANYLDRTSVWVEKMGIEHIREVVGNKEKRDELNERMDLALSAIQEPWSEAINNGTLLKDLYEKVNA